MASDDLISRQTAIDAIMGQPPEPHYPSWYAEQIKALPSAQPEKCDDAVSREEAKWVVFCHRDHVEDQTNAIDELPSVRPSTEPDKRLVKIADLVEGTIDHFDRDDAMDLLYQIKEVLNER